MTTSAKSALVQWNSSFRMRREHAERLAVDVVDDRREKQQAADVPAKRHDAVRRGRRRRAGARQQRGGRRDRGRSSRLGASAGSRRAPSVVTGPSTHARTASALRRSGTTQRIAMRREDLADRHRDRARWHVGERREPAFADLLPPARLVERHDDVRLARVEVRGRIVEGEVAVLADADERDVDGRRRERLASGPADELRILLAVEQVRHRDARRSDQPLEKILPEARRMRGRQRRCTRRDGTARPRPTADPCGRRARSRNWNCEAPVAAMMRALPRAATASAMSSAAEAAAARPRLAGSSKRRMSTTVAR